MGKSYIAMLEHNILLYCTICVQGVNAMCEILYECRRLEAMSDPMVRDRARKITRVSVSLSWIGRRAVEGGG